MKYTLTSFLVILSCSALAQDEIVDRADNPALGRGETVARVTFADKHAYLQHEVDPAAESMLRNMPVVSGDQVETRGSAYAEIELLDGSRIQIGDRSKLEFQAVNEVWNQESLTVVRLYNGSLFLHTTEITGSVERRIIRVDSGAGSAYVEAPGIYRIDFGGDEMSLRTYRGFAELSGESDSTAIYSGEYATVRDMRRPSTARPFNSVRSDRFERWAYERRPVNSVSGKYVDTSLSSYAHDLDDTGSWRYDSELSMQVWVPFVDNGWAPYRNGYWSHCGPYLTWVSYDPFGYLTHHYGRWMWRVGFGWYWVPGYTYSPAWVAWSSYDDYVGWCPLGYWDEPWYYPHGRVKVRTTVVINNCWNYVPSTVVVNRRRSYSPHTVVINGPRRITTRPFYVKREDYEGPTRLARVIADPAVNRRRAETYTHTAGTILSRGNRTSASNRDFGGEARRLTIDGASTGTAAPSRLSSPARRGNASVSTDNGSGTGRGAVSRDSYSGREARTVERRGGAEVKDSNDSPVRRGAESSSERNDDDSAVTRRNSDSYRPSRDDDGSSSRRGGYDNPAPPNRDSGPSTTPPSRGSDNGNSTTPPSRGSDNGSSSPPPSRGSDNGGKYTPPARSNDANSRGNSGSNAAPPSRGSSSPSYTPPSRGNNSNSGGSAPKSSGGSSTSPPSRGNGGNGGGASAPTPTRHSERSGGNNATRRNH